MTACEARAAALDPQWLPHTFGPDGSELVSVFVPREAHQQLMFLIDEHYQGQYRKITNAVADVAASVAEAAEGPLHFIFHTAFCASTLLVKALDIPGRSVGLKEPDILINLANRIARADDQGNRQRLQLALRLLARPFLPGETVIVKPTNFANRLIVPAMETFPEARTVLLHSDLPTFLRSVAKRGMWGRIWGRKLFRSAGAWTSLRLGYDPGEMFELTDLQVIGLAWLMQVQHFSEAAARLGGRVMIVDSADLLAAPAPLLEQVGRFLGLELDPACAAAIAAGPVFSQHSKFSQRDYSVDMREAEHDAAVAAHGEEIGMVVKWVEATAAHFGVSLKPGTSR